MKISTYSRKRKGVVTLVSTVVICAFLLTLTVISYKSAIRNLEGQKSTQLSIDYQAREQAFLRAAVTLTPKYAANTMAENSDGGATSSEASFAGMYAEAIDWADVWRRDTETETALSGWKNGYRNGNVGDVEAADNPTVLDLLGGVDADGTENAGRAAGYTPSAALSTTRSGSNYPVIFTQANGNGAKSTDYPLVSSDLKVAVGESFGADYSDTTPYPDISFGYGNPGESFISRHNWWQLFMHAQSKDAANTAQQAAKNNNEWVLSLYEVPAQLAISSAAFTNIGQINGSDWSDAIKVAGNLYAKEAALEGGSVSGLATTKGATLSGTGQVVTEDNKVYTSANITQSDIDRFYEGNPQDFFPISQSSDFARSLFLPINPGLEFFDLYAEPIPTASGARVSAESWIQYTRGCHQCVMRAVVTSTVGADNATADQTPSEVTFTYVNTLGGGTTSVIFSGADLPNARTNGLPFYIGAIGAKSTLELNVEGLFAWLQDAGGGGLSPAIAALNNSMVINAEYQTSAGVPVTGIDQPDSDPTTAPVVVVLDSAGDLTFPSGGFSLVTNYPLFILSDVNVTESAGATPPLSLFAPSIRYGLSNNDRVVTLTGALASLKQDGQSDILELKDTNNLVDENQIVADLRPIDSLNELPPVNLMNWLVVVQKKRD